MDLFTIQCILLLRLQIIVHLCVSSGISVPELINELSNTDSRIMKYVLQTSK